MAKENKQPKKEKKEKLVALPLSEDYREAGIMFDPSQVESKKAKSTKEDK